MDEIIRHIPKVRIISDHPCYDPYMEMDYREIVIDIGGHLAEIHEDRYGYRARKDGGAVSDNLSLGGLRAWFGRMFG